MSEKGDLVLGRICEVQNGWPVARDRSDKVFDGPHEGVVTESLSPHKSSIPLLWTPDGPRSSAADHTYRTRLFQHFAFSLLLSMLACFESELVQVTVKLA